jgi:hypothetical protein
MKVAANLIVFNYKFLDQARNLTYTVIMTRMQNSGFRVVRTQRRSSAAIRPGQWSPRGVRVNDTYPWRAAPLAACSGRLGDSDSLSQPAGPAGGSPNWVTPGPGRVRQTPSRN